MIFKNRRAKITISEIANVQNAKKGMETSGVKIPSLSTFINSFVNFNLLFSHCIAPTPTFNNFELADNLNAILQRVNKIPFYVSVSTKNMTNMCNQTLPDNHELATRTTFGQAVFMFHLQEITNKQRVNNLQRLIYNLGFSLKLTFHLCVKAPSERFSNQNGDTPFYQIFDKIRRQKSVFILWNQNTEEITFLLSF